MVALALGNSFLPTIFIRYLLIAFSFVLVKRIQTGSIKFSILQILVMFVSRRQFRAFGFSSMQFIVYGNSLAAIRKKSG